jgi:CRISPR type III-A-associated protein Csm2
MSEEQHPGEPEVTAAAEAAAPPAAPMESQAAAADAVAPAVPAPAPAQPQRPPRPQGQGQAQQGKGKGPRPGGPPQGQQQRGGERQDARGHGAHGGHGGHGPGQRPGGPPRLVPIPPHDVLQRIVGAGDPEVTVDWAEKIGKALRGKVHLSQVRRIYGTLKRLELTPFDEAAKRELLLLRPRLAYTVKRQASATGLAQVLEPALRLVGDRAQLTHLVDFFEAILAYHRE